MSQEFFGRSLSIGDLELDSAAVNCQDASIQARLDRIASQYEQLDEVLATLEAKMSEERLPEQRPASAIRSRKPR